MWYDGKIEQEAGQLFRTVDILMNIFIHHQRDF